VDREQRKEFLMRKEETQEEIDRLEKELKKTGNLLVSFGQKLIGSPDHVTFLNAPEPLGHKPANFVSSPYPDIKTIAEKIQELRRNKEELQNIESQLQKKP
jgi:hypothetical protein